MASLPLDPGDATPAATDAATLADPAGKRAELALRAAMALLFLVALVAVLRVLAPAPDGAALHVDLAAPAAPPPPLPDPAALVDLSAQDARSSNAAMPIAEVPAPAAPFLFRAPFTPAHTRARDCLAAAAWYEAGDDPSGERAVVQVVLNRARHPAFAGSVCGVVFQGSERQTGCQFTFTCDGSLAARHPGPAAWARARAIAGAALAGAVDPRVGWATHYHADYVVPKWRDSLTKVAQVGAHLFYRWQGWWGTAPAFRRHGADLAAEPLEPRLATLSPAHDPVAAGQDDTLLAGLSDADDGVSAETRVPPGEVAATLALRENAASAALAPGRTALVALHAAPGTTAPDEAPIRLTFDPALFPGRYAIQALEACGHRPRCVVLGWRGTAGALDTLAFAYRRNRENGGEGAWWDCSATPRSDKAQCLPPVGQRSGLVGG